MECRYTQIGKSTSASWATAKSNVDPQPRYIGLLQNRNHQIWPFVSPASSSFNVVFVPLPHTKRHRFK